MEADEAVTVHRTHDALQAELLADLLVEAGISARVVGTRAIIASESAERRVEVAASDAEEARRFVLAFLAAPPVEFDGPPGGVDGDSPADDETAASDGFPDDDDDDSDPADRQPRLRRIFAAGVTPVFPGASHFYARRPWTGGAILAVQLIALGTIFQGSGSTAEVAVVVFWGMLFYDLIGGQLAVGAWNQGVRASTARQLGIGAAAICLLGVAGVVLAPILHRIHPPRSDGAGDLNEQELRRGGAGPEGLPFPLHLDLSH